MDEGRPRLRANAIRQMAHSYYQAALLYAAVELRIPDLVSAEPVSADDIAAEAGADPAALWRFMRGLVF